MSKEKEERIPKNQSQHRHQTDSQETQQLSQQNIISSQSNSIGQNINSISHAASVTDHGAILNRAPASQQSANRQFLLQLQRHKGNKYVQQVVRSAGEQNKPSIQPKLTLGAAGDKYEQEADRVAKQVVNSISSTSQQPVQQKSPESEEVAQRMPNIQPLVTGETAEVDTGVEDGIQRARGKGQPLAENVRQPMEQAFGADFSGVRVHTDGQSHQLNQSIQARAFTTGQDVFFRQGEYNPGSRGGKELLAHELTHVVQQNRDTSRYVQCVPQASLTEALTHEPPLIQMSGRGRRDDVEHQYSVHVIFWESGLTGHVSLALTRSESRSVLVAGFAVAEDHIPETNFSRSKKGLKP